MVARHEADAVARAERVEEGERRLELGRQADMRHIAGAGDVVRLLRQNVGDDQPEDFHVMGVAPLASPVDISGRALADQLAQRELGQRPEMRVGKMREREHASALAFNARAASSMTVAAGEDDAV
jgi:hypothetical protein